MNKAVFLDRDGVINQVNLIDGKPFPPKNLSELKLLPNVNDALEILKNAGFFLIVITNQPDVSRGKVNVAEVENINKFLKKTLPIDDIFTCYHDDNDNCKCRKPQPGNLIHAGKIYGINLEQSFMIGDRWRDIEAGKNAGCKTFFIDCNYNEKQPDFYSFKVSSLFEASRLIVEMKR